MTTSNNDKKNKIRSIEDALPLYADNPAEYSGKVGIEVEMALYKVGAQKPQIPTAAEMVAMQKRLIAKGYDAQLEAAGVLEYASAAVPVSPASVLSLLPGIHQQLGDFEEVAADLGYTRAPFCILPTTTIAEACDNMVARDRLVVSIAAMKDMFDAQSLNIPLLTTGVQASFSPKDAGELFRMAKRAYALSPLLIAAMNSSSGFVMNDPERIDAAPRPKYYETYKKSGGIAESFLKSASSDDFLRNHIEAVFKTPMHFAYDAEGALMPSCKGDIITFEKLIERGLNTQSNYELAETFLYNDVKICNLRKGNDVIGKRVEVRPADSGMHQPYSVLLLTAALVPDGKTAAAFDALLAEYGFTGNPQADADLYLQSRQAAVEHRGHYMDIPFGRGSMRDFAADVAGLLLQHYDKAAVTPELVKLVDVLMTGECDAKVFAREMPELRDVQACLQGVAQVQKAVPAAKLQRKFG